MKYCTVVHLPSLLGGASTLEFRKAACAMRVTEASPRWTECNEDMFQIAALCSSRTDRNCTSVESCG